MSRRANGEGTAYKVAPGRWEGQVTVTVGGRRRRVKRSGRTKTEVLERLRQVKDDADNGLRPEDRALTVADLLEGWIAAPGDLKPKTIASYRWAIDKHLIPGLGSWRLPELSVAAVEDFLTAKAAEGFSKNSCIRFRAVLGQAIRWAERRDLVLRNVAEKAELPTDATPPREGRALTEEEAHKLLEAARTVTVKIPRTDRTETHQRRTEALWVVQLSLGLRPGEVCGITWADVDFDEKLVHVRRSMKYTDNGHPIGLGEVKTGNRGRGRRTLPLPPAALDALRRHRTMQNEERLAIGKYWPDEWDDLVFRTEAGTPYNPSNLRRDLSQIAKAAGVGKLTRYDLRHSAATLMAAAGVPLEVIADRLGHENVTMARTIYTHATGRPITAGADEVAAMFG